IWLRGHHQVDHFPAVRGHRDPSMVDVGLPIVRESLDTYVDALLYLEWIRHYDRDGNGVPGARAAAVKISDVLLALVVIDVGLTGDPFDLHLDASMLPDGRCPPRENVLH